MMRSTLLVVALAFSASEAGAEAKYNAALVPAVGYHSDNFAFDGSVVGAAMFGEPRSSAWTLGPRLEVGTFAFDTLRVALGPSLHIPIEPFALGVALHIAGNSERTGVALGVGARGFLGFRPYNHYGPYAATGGITLGLDHWLGVGPSFTLGAQLDAMWLSLPILAIGELFR